MKKYIKSTVCIFVIALMALSFSGCGEVKKAEAVLNKTIEVLKASDSQEIAGEIFGEESVLGSDVTSFARFDKLTHEIVSSTKVDDETVVIKTKITAVDMKPVIEDYFGKAMEYVMGAAFSEQPPSEEDIENKMKEILKECVSKEDLALITNEVDIKVLKTDEGFNIEPSEELIDALLGGAVKALEEIGNSFIG